MSPLGTLVKKVLIHMFWVVLLTAFLEAMIRLVAHYREVTFHDAAITFLLIAFSSYVLLDIGGD